MRTSGVLEPHSPLRYLEAGTGTDYPALSLDHPRPRKHRDHTTHNEHGSKAPGNALATADGVGHVIKSPFCQHIALTC